MKPDLPRYAVTESGNVFEPGQGESRGPCVCTVPSRSYGCVVVRQTLQTPLDLLASCDRGHDWDITENLWTGLQQWAHHRHQ